MNILIIGSEGFIGSHCVRYFLAKDYNVYGCDIHDVASANYRYHQVSRMFPLYSEILDKEKFDFCLNAAGNGSVPVSVNEPYRDFEANVADTFRILDTLRTFSPKCKYINISSAAVYGNPSVLPVKENSAIQPVSPYGFHKYLAERLCAEFFALYRLPTCSVRPFSVYGPGLKKQIVWDLFHKVKEEKEQIILFGTGEETRDFIFIDDMLIALETIMKKADFVSEVYNLAGGSSITIKELAKLVINTIGTNREVMFSGEVRKGDPCYWQADVSKIKQLGFHQTIPLEKGIPITVEWLKNQAKS